MASPLEEPLAIILWLTPNGQPREFFRATIRRLAREHDAPVFEPHLTLGHGSVEQMERLRANPFELRVLGIGWSEQFTKTLFVSFELAPELAQIRDSLGMTDAGFDPHLSLLYKELPMAEKKQLARSISLPFACATFDAISAVRCMPETASRADVESWETLGSKPLAP